MVLANYKTANNATALMLGSISAGALSMICASGYGSLFPSTYPYLLTIENFNTSSQVTKREIVKVTARSGDTFTIVRSAGYCPASYSATTQTNTAYSFAPDSDNIVVISLKAVGEQYDDINAEIVRLRDTAIPAYLPLAGGALTGQVKQSKGTSIASSTIVALSTATGNEVHITGTTTITGFDTVQAGAEYTLIFDGVLTLTHNATSLFLSKAGGNITTAVNDVMKIVSEGSGNWRCISYEKADGTPLVTSSQTVNSMVDNAYANGEDVTAGNAVFIEPVTPFTSATTWGNIGDVNGDKRVSFPIFGSGVSATTLSLALKRVLATTVDLTVRIETDNAGSPSGTLAHANANTTVDRTQMLTAPTSVNDDAVTTSSGGADTASAGYRIYANYTSRLTTVNLSASCTATRVRLFSDAGALLATATVISNVATFSYILVSGTYYRIEADNNGASYTLRDGGGAWAPRNRTNINYISASLNQSATAYTGNSWNIHSIDTVGGFNNTITFPGAFTLTNGVRYHVVVVSGTYGSENVDATNYYQIGYSTNHTTTRGTKNWNGSAWSAFANSVFPYVSSTLCLDNVLSKTSATYSYKIDWYGIASETKTVGQFPKIIIGGIDSNQASMTLGATQYLSNTAGAIASSAGTNSKKIGKAVGTTQIKIIDIPL